MSPTEINVAIAESLGWKTSHNIGAMGGYIARGPDGYSYYHSVGNDHAIAIARNCPDFHGSLDACAQFEARLTDDEQIAYVRELVGSERHYLAVMQADKTRSDDKESFIAGHLHALGWDEVFSFCIRATAPQRCEAYLKAKGLWKPKP